MIITIIIIIVIIIIIITIIIIIIIIIRIIIIISIIIIVIILDSCQDKIVFNRQRFGWSQTKHPLSVAPRKGAPKKGCLKEVGISFEVFIVCLLHLYSPCGEYAH